MIFPLVGFFFILLNTIKAFKFLKIINNGVLTYGNYTHKERTNIEVNDQEVYKLFFEYKTLNNNKLVLQTKTHNPNRLTDEEKELIVYHKDNPKIALVVDELKKSIAKYIKQKWV